MKPTFRALNGLRLFAALAVVSYHYAPEVVGFRALPSFLQNCVHSGPVAMGFFYILSGFVLAHAYSDRPPQTPAQRRSFWFARFARLYPIYILAFIAFLPMAYEKYLSHPAVGINGPRTFVLGGILGILGIQAWTPLSQAWNGPSWSLSVEAFLYILCPFVLIPIARAPWKKLLPILAALWIAMVALGVAHELHWLSAAVWGGWIMYNPLYWSPLFLIGISTYKCSGSWSHIGGARASLIGGIALGVLILLCGVLSGFSTRLLMYGGAVPLMALIVLAFSHPTSLGSRMAGTRLLYEAGAASYVTYILQSPIWHAFRMVTDRLRHVAIGAPGANWQFLAYVLFLLAVSTAIQVVIGKPTQNWLVAWRSDRQNRIQEAKLSDPGIEAV